MTVATATQANTPERSSGAPTAANPRRWWVLAVMSLSIFMIFVDNTVVNTAIPSIARDLEASTSVLQWVVDSYTLVLAGLVLAGGTIGDRFGRRRWMMTGMVTFGLASAGAALSDSANTLIAFRALQGVGAALVMPATLSILTDVFPREERAKAIGIWTGAGGLGVGFGPAVGGYVVEQIDWAAVFWLHLPVVAIALVGLMIVVPESRESRPRRLDIPGTLLATGGLLAVVYGIIQGSEAGWTAPQIVAAFALGLTALVAFAVVELRSAEPMLPLRFFRERDFTGAVLIIGLVYFALLVTLFFLAQLFQLVQDRSPFEAGLLFVPVALAFFVGAPISGVLVQHIGPRRLLLLSLGAMIAGMLLMTQLDAASSTFQVAATLFLFGLSGGLGLTPLTDTVMAAVPVDDAGIGSAVNDVSRELGGALGTDGGDDHHGDRGGDLPALRLRHHAWAGQDRRQNVRRGIPTDRHGDCRTLLARLLLRSAGLRRSGCSDPSRRGRPIGVGLDRECSCPAAGDGCHHVACQRAAQRRDQGGRGSKADRRPRRCP